MSRKVRLLSVCGVILALTIIFNSGFAYNSGNAAVYSDGAMLLSQANVQDYQDITGHWAEKTLRTLISKGLVSGVNVGGKLEVQPNRNITRAEFLTILMRVGSYAVVADKVRSFTDVGEKAWFREAVDKAVSNGIAAGYPDNTFKPNNPIKRAEMAELIAKVGGWKVQENIDKIDSLKVFKDVVKSKWYFTGVMINKLMGTIGGYPDGTCKPENNATRAEAMTIFSKYLDIVAQTQPEATRAPAVTPTPTAAPTPTATPTPMAGQTPMTTATPTATPIPTSAGVQTPMTTATPTPTPTAVPTPSPTPTPEPVRPDTPLGLMCFDASGSQGSMVFFQVYAYGLKDLGKFDFKITYDSSKVVALAVNKGSVKAGDYLPPEGVDLSGASTGTITVSSNDTSPLLSDRGTLFTVVFRILPDATGNTDVILSGKNSGTPEFYKTNGQAISPVTNDSGSIVITN